ncbi:fumarylacetoacetate hydrolase family protein [Halobium salinum]|uniref:Fumarylacetoacetate hydrolase family protein n=1 Tax=Halobium salinum TaxID=1364940 RepID=A0ABD5PHG7_9EURY|nr:fumarylacetoacetate hydrolase family protein [Halobium salinum]
MQLARLLTADGPVTGRLEDGVIHADEGRYQVGVDGRLLPPCTPSAVYCVGRNFAETLEQREYDRPEEPDFFIKPPTSVTGHEQPITYPEFTEELTYAGELAAVIEERCRNLSPETVSDVVLGYTILNDVDALDQQGRTARKAFDGSGPLGPWIETEADPRDIDMWTDISGERRQESNTSLMLFKPSEVISYLSKRFTFQPGDVISFGSPANPGTVEPGDTIEITYEGIGTLRNTIVDQPRTETPTD